jgi:pyruvate dehydrogenase E2 component (dihydrolipoamide acetyltransferase)
MSEKIPMLAFSPTMEEGIIIKWMVAEGHTVAVGDVLCEIETDKATMDYESPADGILLKISAKEGQSVPVGDTIAIIGEEGERIEVQPMPEQAQPSKPGQVEPKQIRDFQPKSTKVRSSPLARKLAKEHGLELSDIQGTGPNGRITESDVRKTAKAPPPREIQWPG